MRSMRALPLSLALAVLTAPALAQETLIWETSRYEPFEPSELGLAIFYGAPQTDLMGFVGHCMTSDGTTSEIRATMTANLGAATEGQAVLVEFDANLPAYQASASGVGAEVGITGFRLDLPIDDELWAYLAQTPLLRYRLRGQTDWVEYPGDTQVFSSFRSNCAALGAANPPLTSGTAPVSAARNLYPTCDDLGSLASTETGQPRDLSVSNETAAPLRVFWLDTNGAPVEMGQLPAGQSATLGSDAGHYWVVTDSAGNCRAVYTTDSYQIRVLP